MNGDLESILVPPLSLFSSLAGISLQYSSDHYFLCLSRTRCLPEDLSHGWHNETTTWKNLCEVGITQAWCQCLHLGPGRTGHDITHDVQITAVKTDARRRCCELNPHRSDGFNGPAQNTTKHLKEVLLKEAVWNIISPGCTHGCARASYTFLPQTGDSLGWMTNSSSFLCERIDTFLETGQRRWTGSRC